LAEGKAVRVCIPLTGDLMDMTTLGRLLGQVWINSDGVPDKRDLSATMVSEGLATREKPAK
jgi:endonuclease YncB( thermonuclease family)